MCSLGTASWNWFNTTILDTKLSKEPTFSTEILEVIAIWIWATFKILLSFALSLSEYLLGRRSQVLYLGKLQWKKMEQHVTPGPPENDVCASVHCVAVVPSHVVWKSPQFVEVASHLVICECTESRMRCLHCKAVVFRTATVLPKI